MAKSGQVADSKLKVFVSYSRQDLAFAERLVAALERRDLAPRIDTRDLPKLEDWRAELSGFIQDADAVVFIISQGSISSQTCSWELEQVAAMNKRLAPIVLQRVPDDRIPAVVSKINYLFFDPPNDFETQADALAVSLQTDLVWLKEHTRLGTVARRWDERNHPTASLLRGHELGDAEHWIAARPRGAPEPTALHRALIEQSRRTATRRQRTLLAGSVATAVIGISLAGLAYWQRGIAVQNELEATKQRDQALLTQSRFLTDQARQANDAKDHATSVLLALEALPTATRTIDGQRLRPRWMPAEASLNAALADLRERVIFKGHSDPVNSVAVMPDGKYIVTASGSQFRSHDSSVRFWDATTGTEVRQFKGHAGPVNSVGVTPDGKRILTGSEDGTARLFDATTGAELLKLDNHGFGVTGAAMTPDGTRIVTASTDGLARLWDARTGVELLELRGHDGAVLGVTINGAGTRIVTASFDRTARVWDASTGAELLQLKGHTQPVHAVAVSADGALIVTASSDDTARIWDANTGAERLQLKGHTGAVRSVAVSPDGSRIVTGSADGTARIWDAATGRDLGTLKGHSGWVRSAVITPDGRHIVTGSEDRTARIWDATVEPELFHLQGLARPVLSIAAMPDGSRVVTGSADGLVLISDAHSGAVITRLEGHTSPVRSIAVTRDGSRIVTGSSDHTARIWDSRTGAELLRLMGHSDEVLSVAITPDGTRVITGSVDKTARVWDAKTGAEVMPVKTFRSSVWSVGVTPDGSRLMATTGTPFDYDSQLNTADDKRDNAVVIWDAKSGAELAVLKGHTSTVMSVAVTPDGARIVSGSADRTARLWDAHSGRELAVFKGHEGWVESVALSPDGQRLVTGSDDTTIRVWDLQTGTELAVLRGHNGVGWLKSVRAVIAPDGLHILSGSDDGTARVWQLRPTGQKLIGLAEEQAPRCLTPFERAQFFLDPAPPAWCIDQQKWPYDSIGGLVESASLLEQAQFERMSVAADRQKRNKEDEARLILDSLQGRNAALAIRVTEVWVETYLSRGQEMLAKAKDDDARSQFDLALKRDPQASRKIDEAWSNAYIQRGERLLENGKDEEATVQFNLAEMRNSSNTTRIEKIWGRHYYEEGQKLLSDNKDEDAKIKFDAALKHNNDTAVDIDRLWVEHFNARGYELLNDADAASGKAAEKSDLYNRALGAFEQAVQCARRHSDTAGSELAQARWGQGIVLFSKGEYGAAAAAYREAERLDPSHAGGFEWRSMSLLSAQKLAQGAYADALVASMESYLDLTAASRKVIKTSDLKTQTRAIAYALAGLSGKSFAERRAKHTITECDRLASYELDPLRAADAVAFGRINADVAVAACTAAIAREPKQGRLYFQLARAHAKAAEDFGNKNAPAVAAHIKAQVRNIEIAMGLGYPMAFNFMANLRVEGSGVEKDADKAGALYLETFNRISECCAATAARQFLVDERLRDQPSSHRIARELLSWASALGSTEARDLQADLTAKGVIEAAPLLPQATFTDMPPWLRDVRE